MEFVSVMFCRSKITCIQHKILSLFTVTPLVSFSMHHCFVCDEDESMENIGLAIRE